jgi:bacteriorhodopsin
MSASALLPAALASLAPVAWLAPLTPSPAEPSVTLWNWIGTAGMSVGVVAFGLATRRAGSEYAKQSRVSLFFVPLIATALYLGLAMGQGTTTVEGEKVTWLRYVTWFTTTPLLLNQLARLVHARGSVVWSLLLPNQFMIGTGLLAELSPAPQKWAWYAVSSIAFVFILATLLGDLTRESRDMPPDVQALFRRLRDVNIVTWIGYPVVWILGTKGFEVIGPGSQAGGYVLLDLASKVGFGMLVLAGAGALERSGQLAGTREGRERRVTPEALPPEVREARVAGTVR